MCVCFASLLRPHIPTSPAASLYRLAVRSRDTINQLLHAPLWYMLLQVPGACSVSVSRWLEKKGAKVGAKAWKLYTSAYLSLQAFNWLIIVTITLLPRYSISSPIPIFFSIRVIPNCNCNCNCCSCLYLITFCFFCFSLPPSLTRARTRLSRTHTALSDVLSRPQLQNL